MDSGQVSIAEAAAGDLGIDSRGLESLPLAACLCDASGMLLGYNRKAAGLFGMLQPGMRFWSAPWLLQPDGRSLAAASPALDAALRGAEPAPEIEILLTRADGERRTLLASLAPLGDGTIACFHDITERKAIEQRFEASQRDLDDFLLRESESERRFRLLVEAVTDYALYMLDDAGTVTSWNAGAQRATGYGAEEILGCHFSRFYAEEDRLAGEPQRALEIAASTGRHEQEGWRIRKDGSRFWANEVIDRIEDENGQLVGFAKIIRDITDRKQAQEALIESAELARGIIATALDGFVQIDETATILEWNSQMEAIFGWSRAEAVGQKLIPLVVPPDQREVHQDGLDRYLRTGETRLLNRRVQLQALHRNGGEITIEASFTALHRRDGCLFNGFIRDVTERLVAEAQLRQAQKMEAVGQLTGGIAHDFNNLLAAIIPNLESAQERITDKRARQNIANAVRAAERGAKLTHQLLAFSRKQDLVTGPVTVNRLILDMREMLLRTIGPTVAIKTSLEEQLWPAETDAGQLELAILNLALNARDAMPAGGSLTISTANLHLGEGECGAALAAGDYVAIAVADTGTGMSPEVVARAFEPFFTTKEVGRGSGLGLSIVYGLARQSGGAVTIESELGCGTTLRMYLPRAVSLAPWAESASEEREIDAGAPARLLVIDDDAAVREITALLARDFGHEAVEAESGAAGLELLQRDRAFDLLIVDLAMPTMHGAEFAAQARALIPRVPVLFVTGYTDPAWIEQVAKEQMLKKPFRRVELAQKLRAMLGGTR